MGFESMSDLGTVVMRSILPPLGDVYNNIDPTSTYSNNFDYQYWSQQQAKEIQLKQKLDEDLQSAQLVNERQRLDQLAQNQQNEAYYKRNALENSAQYQSELAAYNAEQAAIAKAKSDADAAARAAYVTRYEENGSPISYSDWQTRQAGLYNIQTESTSTSYGLDRFFSELGNIKNNVENSLTSINNSKTIPEANQSYQNYLSSLSQYNSVASIDPYSQEGRQKYPNITTTTPVNLPVVQGGGAIENQKYELGNQINQSKSAERDIGNMIAGIVQSGGRVQQTQLQDLANASMGVDTGIRTLNLLNSITGYQNNPTPSNYNKILQSSQNLSNQPDYTAGISSANVIGKPFTGVQAPEMQSLSSGGWIPRIPFPEVDNAQAQQHITEVLNNPSNYSNREVLEAQNDYRKITENMIGVSSSRHHYLKDIGENTLGGIPTENNRYSFAGDTALRNQQVISGITPSELSYTTSPSLSDYSNVNKNNQYEFARQLGLPSSSTSKDVLAAIQNNPKLLSTYGSPERTAAVFSAYYGNNEQVDPNRFLPNVPLGNWYEQSKGFDVNNLDKPYTQQNVKISSLPMNFQNGAIVGNLTGISNNGSQLSVNVTPMISGNQSVSSPLGVMGLTAAMTASANNPSKKTNQNPFDVGQWMRDQRVDDYPLFPERSPDTLDKAASTPFLNFVPGIIGAKVLKDIWGYYTTPISKTGQSDYMQKLSTIDSQINSNVEQSKKLGMVNSTTGKIVADETNPAQMNIYQNLTRLNSAQDDVLKAGVSAGYITAPNTKGEYSIDGTRTQNELFNQYVSDRSTGKIVPKDQKTINQMYTAKTGFDIVTKPISGVISTLTNIANPTIGTQRKQEFEGSISELRDKPVDLGVQFGIGYLLGGGTGAVSGTAKSEAVGAASKLKSYATIPNALGLLYAGTAGYNVVTSPEPYKEIGREKAGLAALSTGGIVRSTTLPKIANVVSWEVPSQKGSSIQMGDYGIAYGRNTETGQARGIIGNLANKNTLIYDSDVGLGRVKPDKMGNLQFSDIYRKTPAPSKPVYTTTDRPLTDESQQLENGYLDLMTNPKPYKWSTSGSTRTNYNGGNIDLTNIETPIGGYPKSTLKMSLDRSLMGGVGIIPDTTSSRLPRDMITEKSLSQDYNLDPLTGDLLVKSKSSQSRGLMTDESLGTVPLSIDINNLPYYRKTGYSVVSGEKSSPLNEWRKIDTNTKERMNLYNLPLSIQNKGSSLSVSDLTPAVKSASFSAESPTIVLSEENPLTEVKNKNTVDSVKVQSASDNAVFGGNYVNIAGISPIDGVIDISSNNPSGGSLIKKDQKNILSLYNPLAVPVTLTTELDRPTAKKAVNDFVSSSWPLDITKNKYELVKPKKVKKSSSFPVILTGGSPLSSMGVSKKSTEPGSPIGISGGVAGGQILHMNNPEENVIDITPISHRIQSSFEGMRLEPLTNTRQSRSQGVVRNDHKQPATQNKQSIRQMTNEDRLIEKTEQKSENRLLPFDVTRNIISTGDLGKFRRAVVSTSARATVPDTIKDRKTGSNTDRDLVTRLNTMSMRTTSGTAQRPRQAVRQDLVSQPDYNFTPSQGGSTMNPKPTRIKPPVIGGFPWLVAPGSGGGGGSGSRAYSTIIKNPLVGLNIASAYTAFKFNKGMQKVRSTGNGVARVVNTRVPINAAPIMRVKPQNQQFINITSARTAPNPVMFDFNGIAGFGRKKKKGGMAF